MTLLRKLFWLALFAAFTFLFVILFEHGTKDYFKNLPKNAATEWASIKKFSEPTKLKESDGTK